MRKLADEYRRAAEHLIALGRRGDPLSRAPYRFAAIHAIELYLSAFLLHSGHHPALIRGLQHNLARRAVLAVEGRLALRQRTVAHLHSVAENREYVTMRYGPEMTATVSQINRLSASLAEVAGKVSAALGRSAPSGKPRET